MKIKINLQNYTNEKILKRNIKKIFSKILQDTDIYEKSCLKDLTIKELSIDFVFCDDVFIHNINKEYRGKDNPTDVISFALFCDDENKIITEEINLGEIIISVEIAKKQANNAGHSFEKEVYFLIAHGILHLLGFDHLSQKEYNFMVEKQNKVVEEF